jgi:Ca2+-transporting ATPase
MFQLGLFSNKWLFAGISIMMALQLMLTYLPPLNHLFQTAPIGVAAWGRIFALSFLAVLVIGLEKKLRQGQGQRLYRAKEEGTATLQKVGQ